MDQQSAAALIMYLNRAIGIVPTTGIEWDTINRLLRVIEGVANGRMDVELKPKPAAQEVIPKGEAG